MTTVFYRDTSYSSVIGGGFDVHQVYGGDNKMEDGLFDRRTSVWLSYTVQHP